MVTKWWSRLYMKYAYAKTQVRGRLIYSCYFSACGVNAIAFLVLWIMAWISKTKYVQPCKKKHPTAPPPSPSFLNSTMGFSNVSNVLCLLSVFLSLFLSLNCDGKMGGKKKHFILWEQLWPIICVSPASFSSRLEIVPLMDPPLQACTCVRLRVSLWMRITASFREGVGWGQQMCPRVTGTLEAFPRMWGIVF